MRTLYVLSILLPTMLAGFGTNAGPLVPAMRSALSEPAAAATCADSGNVAATDNFDRGMMLYMQGDMARAIAAYDEALRLDPAMTVAYVGRGHALHAQGDMDGAMANFDEASRLRVIQKIEWLAGRSPHYPRPRAPGGAVALVGL